LADGAVLIPGTTLLAVAGLFAVETGRLAVGRGLGGVGTYLSASLLFSAGLLNGATLLLVGVVLRTKYNKKFII
jgi:hypothetical protein